MKYTIYTFFLSLLGFVPSSAIAQIMVNGGTPKEVKPANLQMGGYAGDVSLQSALGILYPTGPIIEGWQRIAGYVSGDAVFKLVAGSSPEGFVCFDDLRLHPKNALMVSNVYNSTTFKLSETLDENNYFTRYKYNKEGQLEVIQKETEQGVITVQSAYQSTRKQ